MLDARNLTVRFGALTAVDNVSFTLREGAWLMIVGPNGAGKSTLLGALAQGTPYTGTVLLGAADARGMKPRQRARWMGTLSQNHFVGYAFTVEEIVRLGRYAYRGPLMSHTAEDERAIRDALAFTGMEAQRAQSVLTLSGGELQRAFLAQLFAQNPRVLLLDEPANHLDLAYQQQIFNLIAEWLRQPGRAAISVVHDLSLALRYGTQALLMERGHVSSQGDVRQTLTPEHLQRVYSMDVYGWMRDLLSQWQEETPT